MPIMCQIFTDVLVLTLKRKILESIYRCAELSHKRLNDLPGNTQVTARESQNQNYRHFYYISMYSKLSI